MDPRNGGDLLGPQEGVHPVPRLWRLEGGARQGCCPVDLGGGDPQDPLRVSAGRDNEEEQGVARALLPEDLPRVVGAPGPVEGGEKAQVGPTAGRVGGRREGGSLGKALHTTAYWGIPLVPSYTGMVGRGREGVSPALSRNFVSSPTSDSSSGGCRTWSAASSSDTPPGYLARG